MRMVKESMALILAGVILLLAYGSSGAQQQENPSGSDRVYKPREVDKKAVIDQKSWEENRPSKEGCASRSGTATVRVVLRKTGMVTDAELLGKSGCESFDEGAIRAVERVKFKPAVKGGSPVSQYIVFQYRFDKW